MAMHGERNHGGRSVTVRMNAKLPRRKPEHKRKNNELFGCRKPDKFRSSQQCDNRTKRVPLASAME